MKTIFQHLNENTGLRHKAIRRSLKATILFLSTLLFGILTPSVQAQYIYVWDDFNNNPPGGISGTLILDTPSSSGGAVSDIVSITLSDGGSGSFTYTPANASFTLNSYPFTWNSSQITSMDIKASLTDNNYYLDATENYQFPVGGNLIYTANGLPGNLDYDINGSWVAASPVPEPSVDTLTSILLIIYLAHRVAGAYKRKMAA